MGDAILDVLASIAASLDQASAVQIAFVAAIVCVIGLPLLTLIHELGHAIAVRLRSLRLKSLVVGDADDLILRVGGVIFRFGRMLDDDADAGFVRYDAAHASPDDHIVIALAGPAANLVVAPVFAGLAAIGGTSGPFDACLWLLAVVSVVLAVVDLVPSGTPGTSTSISDGRVVQLAWAARRGPALHWTEPGPEPPAPSLAAEAPPGAARQLPLAVRHGIVPRRSACVRCRRADASDAADPGVRLSLSARRAPRQALVARSQPRA